MIAYLPARSKRSRPGGRRLVTAVLTALLTVLALGLAGAVPAKAAADYTQGVTSTGSGSVQIWFKPTTPASLVDVHYLSADAGQQNFRMTNNAGTWQQHVSGLPSGFSLEYWFTYEKSGPLHDTPHFTYAVGSGGGGGGGGGGGSFPITFQNNTRGTYANAQIYVTLLGQVTPGQWSYMKADGIMTHINHLDANAPGHLTKNGVNYPDMSFTLAQSGGSVPSPTSIRGGRIYVSLGSPLYIPVSPDDQGWGGPDLRDPNDPNTDVYYDWYEYTYVFGQVAFGGNTTQVDQFGFPMTSRLTQTSSGYDTTRGITLTRAQVMSQYAASVGAAFKPLQNTYRIIAPRSSDLFLAGGSQANYLQSTIDQTWSYYSTHPFRLTRLGETFTGGVSGTTLTFTKNRAGPYALRKPSSPDVVACAGALASGSDPEKQLGAEFCAAFNRGVALDTSAWYTPSAYYTGGIKNDYAAVLHTVGLDRRAYAFPYDDINDQSSVQILGNANPPTGLTLGIGW
ncbi:glycoside hydrolase family 64 protein [Streptomyces mirabilis]|uniref:Beta-1,3-glucanase n=1 Tax=Streptomyces mirabilis TaxID=68239 RepID=A0A1I2NEQ1_9ACTN|nr:glycoside hydrolase family 64 protein [Streptomyces mirabilis]SFG00167.1 Beta-1,3-glucanase [Streptomyces mirabilis]